MSRNNAAGMAGEAAALPIATVHPERPVATIYGILHLLGRHALPNLDADALGSFTNLAMGVEDIALRGAALSDGIANLVLADGDGHLAGNFRSGEDVSDLLLQLSDTFELVAGLISICEQVHCKMLDRKAR